MPKHSRSASLISQGDFEGAARASEDTIDASGSPAHTPKYFRASTSPPPLDTALNASSPPKMQCALPPHAILTLPSAAAFDIHYAQEHTNRCSECSANLPSGWMLELHLNERHNPIVAAQRDKEEKTYKCFLPDCDKVTLTPEKRRLHLIDKHGYPRSYDFRMVDRGIGHHSSALRGGQSKFSGRRRRVSESGNMNSRSRARENKNTKKGKESIGPGQTRSNGHSLNIHEQPANEANDLQQGSCDGTEVARMPSKNSKGSTEDMDVTGEIDAVARNLASLQFVPMSVRLRAKKEG